MNNGNIEITDYYRFENVIKMMEESLRNLHDIFEKEKKNNESLNDGSTWIGKSSEHTYRKVKELEDNFGPIEYSLNLYINFLKKTLEDYKLMDKTINKKTEAFSQSLNLDSWR